MEKKKPAKQKKSASKKSDKAKLAAGAAAIRKAQKELKGGKGKKAKKAATPPPEPVVIPESTRPIQEILKDRVTMLPGSIGLELSADTPIEESLRILDWATTMSDHVGFMIGDVINHGSEKFGEKYKAALNQTGRAISTLNKYARTAAAIPPSKRIASLSFNHHYEILPLAADSQKMSEVLKEVGAQADKGNAPTTKELRFKVAKLTPRKVKKPKKTTSGKGRKGKDKPAPIPYEPTPEEQAKLDSLEDGLSNLNKEIESSGVEKILLQLDNKEKKRWTETLLLPVFELYNTVVRYTGYC